MKYPEDYINKIIQGDCLEIMKGIPDNSVDLVVTSPPYNVGKNNMTENKYKKGDKMSQEEYYLWSKRVIDEMLRISKTSFYNIQMLSDNKRTVLSLLGEYKNSIKDIIIWNKNQVAPAIEPGVMNSKFEFIIIFSNDRPEKRKFMDGNFRGNFSNVITGNNASGNKYSDIHRATFPSYLPDTLISNFSKEGDIVLDMFIGIGTTAESCKNLNRKFIGIELDEEYCQVARDRLKQQILL